MADELKMILEFYLTNCKHIYEEFSQQDDIDRNLELAQSQATAEVKSLFLSKLPKKWTEKDYNIKDRAESWMAKGRNQILTEIEKVFDEL